MEIYDKNGFPILKSGDIVVTRNNRRFIYIESKTPLAQANTQAADSVFYSDSGFITLSSYNERLENADGHEWDICRVYRCGLVGLNDIDLFSDSIIWKRKRECNH